MPSKPNVPIGIVFSTSGAYAGIGRDARDGALLALDTVNDDPAFDFRLDADLADPAGVAARYPVEAERQITGGGCRHIVGGITSWSRKELIPVVERRDALLWYAFPYEGYEGSDHVVYLGACPNQHIVPLLDHVVPRHGARPYLVGSNYIWGWEIARIARELIVAKGGDACGGRFVPLGSCDVAGIIAEVREMRPDFVVTNLLGPSAAAFIEAYAELARADPFFDADRRPLVSCNLTEADLAGLVKRRQEGHLVTAVFFNSLETEAAERLRHAAARRGHDRPLTSCFASTYAAVTLLAEAIRDAGSDRPEAVRAAATARPFASPLGPIVIDPTNQHAALTPHIGRVGAGAHIEILASAPRPVPPDPYLAALNHGAHAAPAFRRTSVEHLKVVS